MILSTSHYSLIGNYIHDKGIELDNMSKTGQHNQGIEVTEEMVLAIKQVCDDYGLFCGGYPNEEILIDLIQAVLVSAKACPLKNETDFR